MDKGIVFVSGGAGFIGSQVNQQLNEEGFKTIVFDNLSSGNRQTVKEGTFIEGDLNNQELLKTIFCNHKIQAVMHFAAFTDVGESVLNPDKYYQNNVGATLNLLRCMKNNDIKTFIFSSSAAVYGIPKKDKVKETDSLTPINPYGETKLIVEKILHDFNVAYGMQSCSLRYFNAAGGDPRGNIKHYKKNESNLIPRILQAIQAKTPITINGTDYPTPDGTCIRDYVHVADLSDAHLITMKKLLKGDCASCYNLGNGQGFSIREVIVAAEEVTRQKVVCIEGQRRPGDPPVLLADAEKMTLECNWNPQYTNLKTIIEHAWKARL